MDLFHANSRQKPVVVTTVYSAPDDGRKGRPKHSELLTPNKEHKKLHLVGIYMICILLSIYYIKNCIPNKTVS